MDREQPVSNIRTMDAIVDAELANRTQVLQLLGTFAALALVLAALGIYAVLSFLVSQRTREIGVRMAIGARSQDIVRGMLAYAARLTLAGVVLGMGGGIVTTRLLSSLLFGITPLDWRTFAGVATLLMLVALAAAYVPTRRAALVDPVIALRDDR